MKFEEAVNKFREELKGREETNKNAIDFTISNLRNLIDFGKMTDNEKKTLSDKLLTNAQITMHENEFDSYAKEEDIKQTFQEIKQRILNQTGNECDAKIARDYAIIIINEEIGKRLKGEK